jgi:hypothetical protein
MSGTQGLDCYDNPHVAAATVTFSADYGLRGGSFSINEIRLRLDRRLNMSTIFKDNLNQPVILWSLQKQFQAACVILNLYPPAGLIGEGMYARGKQGSMDGNGFGRTDRCFAAVPAFAGTTSKWA